MRLVRLGIQDEKTAGALTNPLNEPVIGRAAKQRFNAVERIGRAAAAAIIRLRPFVNRGKGQTEFCGDLFGAAFLENLAQKFMRLHHIKMEEPSGDWQANVQEVCLIILIKKPLPRSWGFWQYTE